MKPDWSSKILSLDVFSNRHPFSAGEKHGLLWLDQRSEHRGGTIQEERVGGTFSPWNTFETIDLKSSLRTPSLKTTPWKRRFLLETIIFRCYVSFRECNSEKNSAFGSIHCLKTFNLHPKDSHRNSGTPMNLWQFGGLRPFSSAVRYCQWFAQDGKTNCLRRCRSFGQNGEVILLVWLAVARHTFSKTQVQGILIDHVICLICEEIW